MKKKLIHSVYDDGYVVVNSSIGKEKPKAHPYFSNNHIVTHDICKKIKVGDIVRCDGLLFSARPQTIYVKEFYKKFPNTIGGLVAVNNLQNEHRKDVKDPSHLKVLYQKESISVYKVIPTYKPVKITDQFWVLRLCN